MRVGIALALTVMVAGCSVLSAPSLTPSPVTWGDRVPTPAPAVVINQPVVTQGPDSITLLPISSSGAAIGVAYLFDMPHCGVLSPIDVDGSFWDAVGPANSIDFGGQSGSFQLSTQNSATFTTSDGQVLNLVRHPGSKAFGFCE